VLRQVAAARLGLNPDDIDLCRADTDRTTSAGATSASRQTYISGNAVLDAADNLLAMLKEKAGSILNLPADGIEWRDGLCQALDGTGRALPVLDVVARFKGAGQRAVAGGRFDPEATSLDPKTGQGKPYGAYAYAAQCARVQVDAASGMVRVTDVAAAHDVGRAINPGGVRGQICGGVLMGLGMALMEEYRHGKTQNFQNYHIPTAADAPRIIPLIVEEREETGPFGAKGVGEPALIPTAPAVAGAVGQALGRPVRHLPISLESVSELLAERENEI
jgi:CO/xanthine dehydrogenase Mo-binding subunit